MYLNKSKNNPPPSVRSGRFSVLVGLFLLTLAACFNPNRSENLQCSQQGQCPDGLVCQTDNTCGLSVAPDGAPFSSADTSLASLFIAGVSLTPAFDPAISSYTADISILASELLLSATPQNSDSGIFVDDVRISSGGEHRIDMGFGSNIIQISVRKDGLSQSYQIVVERDARAVHQSLYGKAANPQPSSRFGHHVEISGDTLAISSRLEGSNAKGINGDQTNTEASDSGAVFIFRRNNSQWIQEAYIKASNTEEGDFFGDSIALEGDTLVVSAPFEDSDAKGVDGDQSNNNALDSGAVYVFERTGSSWQQTAYIKAHNTGAGDCFGDGVAISDNHLIVGSPLEDDEGGDTPLTNSGAAYIFKRTNDSWEQSAFLKAFNIDAGDSFADGVDISGTTAVVGTRSEDSATNEINSVPDNAASNSGAAYVFRLISGQWLQEAYLKPSNNEANANFGSRVQVDGDVIAVGAHRHSGTGAAYVFRRNGTSTWTEEAVLVSSSSDANDSFGARISLNGDRLAVGAREEDSAATGLNGEELDNEASNAGAVYLFVHKADGWERAAYIKASNTGSRDDFSSSVCLSETRLLVGASSEDSSANGLNGDESNNFRANSGAFYLFE